MPVDAKKGTSRGENAAMRNESKTGKPSQHPNQKMNRFVSFLLDYTLGWKLDFERPQFSSIRCEQRWARIHKNLDVVLGLGELVRIRPHGLSQQVNMKSKQYAYLCVCVCCVWKGESAPSGLKIWKISKKCTIANHRRSPFGPARFNSCISFDSRWIHRYDVTTRNHQHRILCNLD